MTQKTVYGTTSHKGLYKGNLVKADIYFNTIVFRLYVTHRVAQSTAVSTNSLYEDYSTQKKVWKDSYPTYDRYDFSIDSRYFRTEDEAFECFCECIESIQKYVNFDSDNSIKIAEEIYRIIG